MELAQKPAADDLDIPRLREFGETISHASEAVRHASESLAATAQEQTTLMLALSDSAQILAKESTAVASRLESTRAQAQAAGADLDASLDIVEELLNSVQRLAELSIGTAAAMDDFGRLMGEIGLMTEFVEDVSDETQLLALNAAIEAARAGKHGLGFAVVAGEVGRLAKTTGESTSAIKQLVTQIQQQAELTIASVRDSADRAAASAPVAEAAREGLKGVAGLAREVSRTLDDAVQLGHTHSESAAQLKHETEGLAESAAEQGRQALEAAFSTQRLAYYGAEIVYVSRPKAAARELMTFTAATQLPPGYPPSIGFSRFGEKLAEYTDGRLTVKLQSPYAAPEMELLMRVRSGEIDFASVTTYVASALLPLAQIFDLPFLFANAQDAHAVLDGGLGRRVLNSFEAYGLTGMGYFENGIRHFTNNVREVSRPEDLQGLAIRIQDSVVYLALMHALRATPRVIPFNRVYDALKNGEVDGQENPLPNMLGTRMFEVQKYLTLSAHAYNTQVILANSERLRNLSDDDRDAIRRAFDDAIPFHREAAAKADEAALAELRKYMQVRPLSNDERNEFIRAAYFVWERMQPLFDDEIYDLLLGGDLVSFDRQLSPEELRASQRSFTLDDIVEAIDSSVIAVRQTATQSAGHSHAQVPRLNDLARRSGQMSDRNEAVAQRFGSLQERFDVAQLEIGSTRATVQELARAVASLAQMAADSRRALDQFATLMGQIGDIIQLVRSVSDRTNLLALNAAIEAARAGEFGKGFNVVASEVRSLADKTRASTQQMKGVLADLSGRGKSAGSAIASGVGEAERSARQAAAAEDALDRIGTFAAAVVETLAIAAKETSEEAKRAFAMRGNFEQMAVMIENHGTESLESVKTTDDLERQRNALFGPGQRALRGGRR